MMHEIEDIEQERDRVQGRPPASAAPPDIAAFQVYLASDAESYVERIRGTLSATLELAASEPFDGEDLPTQNIPEWFRAISGDTEEPIPEFSRHGSDRYVANHEGGAWKLQDWLYRFDPESEFRGWSWWDITRSGEDTLRIWVDTWGEPVVACDDLRWLAYVCGAEKIEGPVLLPSAVWAEEAFS